MNTFFADLKRITSAYALNEAQHLAVLQWLAREVNARGGKAGCLDLRQPKESQWLDIPHDSASAVRSLLSHALVSLPRRAVTGEGFRRTRRILRTIARDLSQQRKRFSGGANQFVHFYLERLRGFCHRKFASMVNECHPGARSILDVCAQINDTGEIEVRVIFGYPRDSSSWTITSHDADEWMPDARRRLSAELTQRDGESGAAALERIVAAIDRELVPIPGDTMYGGMPWAHRENIRREQWYQTIEPAMHEASRRSGSFTDGHVKPDTGTLEAFGNVDDGPYTQSKEVASMLADLLAREDVHEAELTALADGLKRGRRLREPNALLQQFVDSMSTRDWRNRHGEAAQAPNYDLLDRGVAAAMASGARTFVVIPRAGIGNGMIRVPIGAVEVDRHTHTISYRGRLMDTGAIRQFDVV